jgi:glycosyltransferase involved in cell wall biosynthesis
MSERRTDNGHTLPNLPGGSIPAAVDLSVVCPFFNEAGILRDSVLRLVGRLNSLGHSWELILVNDGSTDASASIALRLADEHPGVRLVSYHSNRGRGHALRRGIAVARGGVVVTTEIDLSWGEDIVGRLYLAMIEHPEVDLVVASPNVPGGGYSNVPSGRILLSRMGNLVIRAIMSNAVTMNTGMTRAYRREVIQSLPLEEDGKEFHLEVILKAQAFQLRMIEIPCVLAWNREPDSTGPAPGRRSAPVGPMIVTHLLFALFANPLRYLWGVAALGFIFSLGFLVWATIRLALGLVSVYGLVISLAFATIGLLFVSLGVIVRQNSMIQREMWTLKRDLFLRNARLPTEVNAGGQEAPRQPPAAQETG